MHMDSPTVLVPLAQGCEELEAVTIIDILVRGGIEVTTASLDNNQTITASRGVQLLAQKVLDQVESEHFDMIVLPGGLPGADYLEQSSQLISMLKGVLERGGKVAAICAAPKVLVKAGLLDNKSATSYPGFIDVKPAKGMNYIDQAVVTDGQLITSKGPGTAMDFALELVEKLQGKNKRDEVEKALMRF